VKYSAKNTNSFYYLFTKTETNYEEYIIIIYLLESKK